MRAHAQVPMRSRTTAVGARKPPFKEGITDLDTGTVLYDASVAELVNGRELTIPLAAPTRRHLSEAS